MRTLQALALIMTLLCTGSLGAHGLVDLAVRSPSPGFIARGGSASLDVAVDVLSYDPAYGVVVTLTMDGATRMTGVQAGSAWRCNTGPARVLCSAEELGPGAHVLRLALSVPNAEQSVGLTATVEFLGGFDPVEANNTALLQRRTYDPSVCGHAPPALLASGETLRWTAVPGASSYQVLAGVDGEALRIVSETDQTELGLRFSGGDVNWRVRAQFENCPAVESEPGSFVSTAAPSRLFAAPVGEGVLSHPAGVALVGDQVIVSDAEARKFFAYDAASQNLQPVPLLGDIIVSPPSIDGGLAGGPGGYLFFVDQAKHVIWFGFPQPRREVFVAAGKLQQPGFADAGGNRAQFASPTAIAVNGQSEMFVSDTGNNAIRKIAYSGLQFDFIVTTVARDLNAPSGIAVDAGGSLIVADRGSHTVRRVTPAGAVTTVAGQAGVAGHVDGTAALFNEPYGIAVDERGNIYVSEIGNRAIRKIAPNGRVTTLAAGIVERPGLITITSDGTLWIPDEATGRLLRGPQLTPGPRRRSVGR
jgi:hypothetical protein